MARPPEKPSIPLKKAPAGEYGVDVETQVTQLMTAAKGGDDAAFDQLTRTLRRRAFAVARALVGSHDDALDLTQEAFLKTYRARATYRESDPFLPWFHRILRNTCFSFLRKKNRIRAYSLTVSDGEDDTDWEIADEEVAVSVELERKDVHVVFREGFRRLTARDREILTLRHFQELAYREIAQTLGIPEGTVMSRLYHARRKLRDLLSPHLDNALEDYAPPIRSGRESVSDQP